MHEVHTIMPLFGLPPHTAFMIYTSIVVLIFAFILKGSLSLIPGKLQSIIEVVIEAYLDLADEIIGKKARKFLPLILTIGIYVLFANTMGMIPGLYPSTANINTNAALAIIVFVVYNVAGFQANGLGYIKHFFGPIETFPLLIKIPFGAFMFVIEVVSHIVRPVSLSMRLFGNIFGHELLVAILVGMIFSGGIITGLGFYFLLTFSTLLGVLVVVIQALIFALLTMAYIGGAVEEGH